MSDLKPKLTVDLLTGFLGAGKTRLLQRLLKAGALPETALLVNEVADLPIDQRLLEPLGPITETVAGNCLCCAIDGDLRAGLLRLLERRAEGSVPAFSRILIETSGMADPAPVIATLLNDRRLKQRLRFGVAVALVDLANLMETLDPHGECVAQLVAADRLLLTKTDLVDDARRIETAAAVHAVNPTAEIVTLDPGGELPDGLWAQPSWRRIEARGPAKDIRPHRHSALSATVLRWPDPVDWAGFAAWLSLLLYRHGAQLLRVKGLLRVAGADRAGPVVVQAVRHLVYPPEHLPGDRADGTEIVVVGRDIDPVRLRRSFEIFMRLGTVSGRAEPMALIS